MAFSKFKITLVALALCLACGCVYKGGKVIDGTNLAIGIVIPGTDWHVNVLDYVGGVRIAGNDSTHIIVSNEVHETNSYFGVVTTQRHTKMTADIEPLSNGDAEDEKKPEDKTVSSPIITVTPFVTTNEYSMGIEPL